MNDNPEPAYTERPDEVLRREDVLNLIKPRINELLWSCLPSSTPLGLADRIATEFFERIMRVWDAAETTAGAGPPAVPDDDIDHCHECGKPLAGCICNLF